MVDGLEWWRQGLCSVKRSFILVEIGGLLMLLKFVNFKWVWRIFLWLINCFCFQCVRLTSPGRRDLSVTWNVEGDLDSGGGGHVCVRFSKGETGRDETEEGETNEECEGRLTDKGEVEEEERDFCDISVKGKLTHEMRKEVTTTGEGESEDRQYTHLSLNLTTRSSPTNSLTPAHSPLVTFTSQANR